MPRTYAEIFDIVRQFCRINTGDTNQSQLVQDAIDMAFFDISREHPWPELLVLRATLDLTGVSAGGLIPVPDHIEVEEVKFIRGTPNRTWELIEKNKLVPPAPFFNYPRSYQIVQGIPESETVHQMSIEPYSEIDEADDEILFSYYKVPALFSSMVGPTLILSDNWENEIIKKAEHYVLAYMGKTDVAAEIWKEVLGRMGNQQSQNNVS